MRSAWDSFRREAMRLLKTPSSWLPQHPEDADDDPVEEQLPGGQPAHLQPQDDEVLGLQVLAAAVGQDT